MRSVGAAVAAFVPEVRSETMPEDVADELARALRITRHLGEAARLAPRAGALRWEALRFADIEARDIVQKLLAAADECGMLAERREDSGGADAERAAALDRFLQTYQRTKAALLGAVVARRLAVEAADGFLDALDATRGALLLRAITSPSSRSRSGCPRS